MWVTGGRALTEQEAAVEIVSEARLLLREDLAQLGVQWDPAKLPTGAPLICSPEDPSSEESDASSASHLSPLEAQRESFKSHQMGTRMKSRVTGKRKEESEKDVLEKGRTTSQGGPEGEVKDENADEAKIRQTASEVPVEKSKERVKSQANKSTQNSTGNSEGKEENRESEQEGEKLKKTKAKEEAPRKESVSIRPENHHLNQPVAKRSLTQELAELLSSPLAQPLPQPQLSPSPAPPSRFRAPISRMEQQSSRSTSTANGECITVLTTSPLPPGRVKHSRALSKVLQSIQIDRGLQDNTEHAETSNSKPTKVSSLKNSEHLRATVLAPDPVHEHTHADNSHSAPSVCHTTVPIESPEAKRRKIDAGEVDGFSSPELYTGDKTEDGVKGRVNMEEESFGDSFELDTQTELIIGQQAYKCTDDSERGTDQLIEMLKERDEEMVEAAVEQVENADERRNELEDLNVISPRFNISLTDSQMEIILNTSHQVSDSYFLWCIYYKYLSSFKKKSEATTIFSQISPGSADGHNVDKDEDARADHAESESLDRSSSFLFDSLCDSPQLAAPKPHQTPDQSEEEECASQEVRVECPLPSTQQRRRSELLANQEAEEQEAIQWGESFFNLSEWGDSLLVGEHFLERQSVLRCTEKTEREEEEEVHSSNYCDLQEEPLVNSQSQPRQMQLLLNNTKTQNGKACNNQTNSNIILVNDENAEQEWRHEMVNEELAKRVDKKRNDNIKKEERMAISFSDNPIFKNPNVQNASESAFYCSPGLQEIFDRWPSMSDQPGSTGSQTQTAARNTDDPALQLDRKRKKSEEPDSDRKDFQQGRASSHDSENATERPSSAADLIPPTQEKPPVTPRVKLTTSSVQSPVTTQPLNQSTPSSPFQANPANRKCLASHTGNNNHPSAVASASDSKQEADMIPKKDLQSVPRLSSKTKPLPHISQTVNLPRDCSSPPSLQPKPSSDIESPVTPEGFTLQLSQDESLCSSNSGTFSIIDVASDRRLFDTFIKEWKTKERFSLALACEKRELRQQPEGEIGGKHRRGI